MVPETLDSDSFHVAREVPPGGAGLRVVGDGPGLFRVVGDGPGLFRVE